jgi:cellulose synthase/poly-beta-1,6-N-acetylglucosamine synthase-like glycosyltransferase
MKNEEKVAGRILRALLKLNYPTNKMEIIVVEDGSLDKTLDICNSIQRQYPNQIKIFHKSESKGKPSALNYATNHAKGDIIAIFDADNIPDSEALLKAAEYFEDSSIGALQGTTCSLNADKNRLTKFLSYEEAVWLKTYIRGKDALNLFVPLTGSCQFIRRKILIEMGGWDENSIAEDVEMAARLMENGYITKYTPEVVSWQETPSTLSQLINQRTRWFRGYMDTFLKYGKLIRNLNRRVIDAEITLAGPFAFALSFLGYFSALYPVAFPNQTNHIVQLSTRIASLINLIPFLILGVALIYVTKPRKISNLLWLPFIYVYWIIQTFISLRALIQIILRKPRIWTKTSRTGEIHQTKIKSNLEF